MNTIIQKLKFAKGEHVPIVIKNIFFYKGLYTSDLSVNILKSSQFYKCTLNCLMNLNINKLINTKIIAIRHLYNNCEKSNIFLHPYFNT